MMNINQLVQPTTQRNESSDDFMMRQELDEGRASYMTEFNIRSPNIQKKRMDFGYSGQNEYVWSWSNTQQNNANDQNQEGHLEMEESFLRQDIKTEKIVNKWGRALVLDKRGKLFQWDLHERFSKLSQSKVEEESKSQQSSNQSQLKEIEVQIDGKQLSKLVIKDIACTSNSIFMATENGEVIIGQINSITDKNEQPISNDIESIFRKKQQKYAADQQISLSFSKLNSIQSHFISQVSCGQSHSLLLTSSGFVYSFGKNEYGQLGQTSASDDLKEPTIIFQLLNLKVFSISCGQHHNIVIGTSRDTMASTFQIYSTESALFTTIDKNKTLVYGWGFNQYGQLGLGDDKNRNVPTLVELLLDYNFKKVKCGKNHTGLLDENSCLFIFGQNNHGQIGISTNDDQFTPVSIFAYAQDAEEGQQDGHHENQDGPQIIITKFVINFTCQDDTSLCLTDENEILIWGKNTLCPNLEANLIEPELLVRFEDHNLNVKQSDNQTMENLVYLKNHGVIGLSKQRNEKDLMLNHSGQKSETHEQSFASSIHQNRDQSYQMSQGNSFMRNDNNYFSQNRSVYNMPQSSGSGSTGISFNKEFENLLQYIAITAGNTNMPEGIKPMTFRPGNLPPKTNEEERLHQKLVEDNRKQYLQKVKEREKQQEKKRIELERKEKRLHEMKQIWENDFLPNWDQVKRTKRVRELWVEGLPPVIRGKVWFYAFGNRNSISKDFYFIMADKGRKLRKLLKEITLVDQEIIDNGGQPRTGFNSSDKENENNQSSGMQTEEQKQKQSQQQQSQNPKVQELNQKYDKLKNRLNFLVGMENISIQNRERSISIIETDLPRTFPQLGFFKVGGMHYEQLQRMLEAFTLHRPDIGYVQGMSYVAATLLLYMDEHSAFVTFCNMITKYPIMPFYTFNEAQVRKLLQLFKQVFSHNLPELCDHLEMENIQPKQYVYEWFMTLFTRALNLSLLSRVWDFYFLDGIFVLFQTAIAILRILEKPLLQSDFEGIMKIIQNVSDYVTDEEELVSFIYDVSYPKWIYDELPKLEFEFLKQI